MQTSQTDADYDLFISFAPADHAWVEGYLIHALQSAGLRLITEADFKLGVPRIAQFEQAVIASHRTLLVLSPAYLGDDVAQFVDILAQTYGLHQNTWQIIPLILRPVPNLPPRLAMLHGLDATHPADHDKVVARLAKEMGGGPPASLPLPPCPYPGLAPFSEADQRRFFGRSQEVAEMVERLNFHPFLAVIGPSGSGKSSLVAAGLLPALRTSRLFGPQPLVVRIIRPTDRPQETLAAATDDLFLPKTLERRPGVSQRFVLVVDQFEELFSQNGPGKEPFQTHLSALADQPDCLVILTVRADFYPDLMASALWPRIQAHRFEVLPLNEEGIRQVVEEPAAQVGVWVDPLLVERIVADAAGEPGSLPLIQETLHLLWDRVQGRYLPLDAYNALIFSRPVSPGAEPPRSGLHVAIARRADQVLAALGEPDQASARRIFLGLVQFGQGRADTRRRQFLDQLAEREGSPELFRRVVNHLTEHRLLIRGSDAGGRPTVDLAHEALIRHWPRLRTWIDEFREAELVRRRLEQQAEAWEPASDPTADPLEADDGRLLRGGPLAEAERWLAGDDARVLGISPQVKTFVQSSRRRIDAEVAAAEAARQRELALERSARRRAYTLAAIFGIIAAVAVVYFARIEFYRWQARSSGQLADIPGTTARLETTEVTNRRWRACVLAGACEAPPAQLSTYFGTGQDELPTDDLPITGVDAIQAARFCAWIGRRLPAYDEWKAAATNGGQTLWPWGNDDPDSARAVVGEETPLAAPLPVGSLADGGSQTSPPLYDLVGNVQEWTATLWDNGPQPEAWNGASGSEPDRLTMVGSGFEYTLTALRTEREKRNGLAAQASPSYRQASLGFRCAGLSDD